MKILLTGACGKLARAIRRAAGEEHRLILMDVAEEVVANGGICASITNADAVMRAAEGCDAIIHTAAMHGGWFGKASHAQFIQTNVLGAEHLFQAALAHGIRRLVMSSTMEVVLGRRWNAYGAGAVVDETTPPRPDWIYPVTKLMVEQMGSFYADQHGLEVVSLRYMTLNAAPVEEIGFALLSRHVAVEDAARANLAAATRCGLRNLVLHIGPDTPLTQADVNTAASDPWGVLEKHWPGCSELLKRLGLSPPSTAFWPVTRIERAKLVLDWQPRVTFQTFLQTLRCKTPAQHA